MCVCAGLLSTLCATHVVLVIHIYCTRCLAVPQRLREGTLPKRAPPCPLLLTLLLQQSFWQLRVADKWTGCMCIVLPVAVAAVPAVGVRSCLAAKTLQLQLFDGICKGYTPHTRRYRRSYTPTPPLWALGVLPVWTFICWRTFTASAMPGGRKTTGRGHKQVISDVKLKESSKDKLIYCSLQLRK